MSRQYYYSTAACKDGLGFVCDVERGNGTRKNDVALKKAGELLGIELLDHVIVTDTESHSFAGEGEL